MAQLIAAVGPPKIEIQEIHKPFETLLRSIVYQQLSGKAAATIYGRVEAHFDDDGPAPAALLKIADDTLRAAGMSWAKIAAAKDLAAKTENGEIPTLAELEKMSNEEIVAALTSVRGIGPWTVEMLLIFRLGRPDVLPITDLGVRRGCQVMYRLEELPKPTELLERGEAWRPFRSVAAWYLWRAVEQILPA